MNLCLRFQDSTAVKRVVSDVMTPCSLVYFWLPASRKPSVSSFRPDEGNGSCCSEKLMNTYQTILRNIHEYWSVTHI